jgi:membrane peptidoglycan carboxypeptidase
VKLERALPKRRILALYLNVAEWGDGIFGAEAAARRWFGVPAAGLSTAQAAVLASMLPAPRKADLAAQPRWLAVRSRRLLDQMLSAGRIGPEEHGKAPRSWTGSWWDRRGTKRRSRRRICRIRRRCRGWSRAWSDLVRDPRRRSPRRQANLL